MTRATSRLKVLRDKLLNLGVDGAARPSLVYRIQTSNAISLIALLFSLLYTWAFAWRGQPQLAIYSSLSVATFLIPFFMNRKGYITLSRIYSLAISAINVTVSSFVYGKESGFYNFFIAVAASAFIYFDDKEKKLTFFSILGVFLCFTLVMFTDEHDLPFLHGMAQGEWYLKDTFRYTILTSLTVTVLVLFQINRQAERILYRSLESLEKERDNQSNLIAQAPGLFIITDPIGNILLFNRASEVSTGNSVAEAKSKSIRDWIPELPALSEMKSTYSSTLRWEGSNGTARVLKLKCMPTLNLRSEIENFIWLGEDITDQLETQSKLREQEQKLEAVRRLAAIGEVSASIAHEINNPLAVIRLHNEKIGQQLLRSDPAHPLLSAVTRIESMSVRISDIIQTLQSLTRKTKEKPYQWAYLHDIVRDSIELVEEKFKKEDFPIRVQLDEPSLRIECRPIQISQIITNFLNNAWDSLQEKRSAIPESRLFVEIRSECARVDNQNFVRIHIIDTGAGLSKETLAHLGEPLFTTKPSGKGMGLGLRLSQAFAEAHSGEISVSSLPEQGLTRFTLTLPQAQISQRDSNQSA